MKHRFTAKTLPKSNSVESPCHFIPIPAFNAVGKPQRMKFYVCLLHLLSDPGFFSASLCMGAKENALVKIGIEGYAIGALA
jgi:hypothetical protein